MILTVDLLKEEELLEIKQLMPNVSFQDGGSTASMAAKSVKSNLQADPSHQATQEIERIFVNAVSDSPLIQQAFLPSKVRKPLLSKCTEGMGYGWHTDSPLMDKPPIRTDVAMTLFLNDPADYEGGELILVSPSGNLPVKLPAGHCVVYPTTMVHCVDQVRKGERLALVSWLQSEVRSQPQRDVIFNISQVLALLNQKSPNSQEYNMLMQSYSNLVRMWAEV